MQANPPATEALIEALPVVPFGEEPDPFSQTEWYVPCEFCGERTLLTTIFSLVPSVAWISKRRSP